MRRIILAMKPLAILLLAGLLAPWPAAGADSAGEKAALQQDACDAWTLAYEYPYRKSVDENRAEMYAAALKRGRLKGDLALDWTANQVANQHLCERYEKRFNAWPAECCIGAKVMQGAVTKEARVAGEAARKEALSESYKRYNKDAP